ncbi:kinesin-like protein KIN-7K, chloroplastic [Raphanus sativus]|uniref:Kinesin-like protein KIN-7K, chloroplastic n=1 Tax=Raphanus sativus TaxID=3726 RepID=A0A9W3BUT4_RAPSA|nr:kinesin-like protein KIN-7K, chloroplastic [Raphanus sativus]XP_056855567.1 kinesin-like protein KIN-7K, chloroplastic [Raphanus sativus]XP_056855568.1 kinesin-like protein KIN-7K, chloroplastic [Raphanus sativus]
MRHWINLTSCSTYSSFFFLLFTLYEVVSLQILEFGQRPNHTNDEANSMIYASSHPFIQEQLNQKTCEYEVANLKQQLSNSLELAQEKEVKLKAKELSESKDQLEPP